MSSPRQSLNKSESSNYTANGDLAIKPVFVNIVSSANLNSQAGYRCTLVPRLPFPVTSFSNIHSQAGYRCTLVTRLPFSVPRSPFPVPRSPFPVPRSPFPVPRSPFLVTSFSNIRSMDNTERMISELFAIQYKSKHFLKCLTFCLFPEYVHVASSTTLSARAIPLLVRIAESFEVCNYLSIKFAVLRRQRNPAKPYRGLPQASHAINQAFHLFLTKT